MKIKILKPQTLLLEGCIKLAFHVGEVVDIAEADALEAIRLGIAEAFTNEPQEKAVTAPQETVAPEPQEAALPEPKEQKSKKAE